jgi:hypothetical protein
MENSKILTCERSIHSWENKQDMISGNQGSRGREFSVTVSQS